MHRFIRMGSHDKHFMVDLWAISEYGKRMIMGHQELTSGEYDVWILGVEGR
jgi:hypothetical protein